MALACHTTRLVIDYHRCLDLEETDTYAFLSMVQHICTKLAKDASRRKPPDTYKKGRRCFSTGNVSTQTRLMLQYLRGRPDVEISILSYWAALGFIGFRV